MNLVINFLKIKWCFNNNNNNNNNNKNNNKSLECIAPSGHT